MERIKLFPAPHIELRVSVSDEMIADYKECAKMAEQIGVDGKDCDTCSWNDAKIGIAHICGMKELERILKDGECDR
ncbi:MAG: hypothetical protein KH828_07780 [Clostridiales bacterium]|nr:hypothetical protein [Clostridiales bacterium]